MATKAEILDSIANMTVLELSELLQEFEEKFGVTAAAPVAAVAAGSGGPAEVDASGSRRRACSRTVSKSMSSRSFSRGCGSPPISSFRPQRSGEPESRNRDPGCPPSRA